MDKALLDTSILLEPFTKLKSGKEGYQQRELKKQTYTILKYPQGQKFIPAVSMSVLGELQYLLYKKENLIENIREKRDEMNEILQIFFDKCEMIEIKEETISIAYEIFQKDRFLDPLDVLHFASAITGKCKSFIFIDKVILKSQIIKEYSKRYTLNLISLN